MQSTAFSMLFGRRFFLGNNGGIAKFFRRKILDGVGRGPILLRAPISQHQITTAHALIFLLQCGTRGGPNRDTSGMRITLCGQIITQLIGIFFAPIQKIMSVNLGLSYRLQIGEIDYGIIK